MNPRLILVSLVLAVIGTAPITHAADSVSLAGCFPIEQLAPEDRAFAESLLLRAMDREALYTIVGGMKPMSSGWFSTRVDVEKPDILELERVNRVLPALRNGNEVFATVQPFWRVFENRRFAEGIFVHRSSFTNKLASNRSYWAFYGITPASDPLSAVMMIDSDQTPRRNRAYGDLFGYPRHAVDFFVQAEESRRKTGQFVQRDFFSIPVFEAATNRFVYAVPKGHVPNEEDLRIQAKAEPILAYYRNLRARFIGPDKPGIVALLREWFHDGRGGYSSSTALRKAEAQWARRESKN
jgi:hypothetical protein